MAQLDILVVVPAFNEAGFIEGCVSALNDALAPRGVTYNVVVVDNGSTDETAVLAQQTGAEVLKLQRSSVSHARNVGAKTSDSRFIAFIDADVAVTHRWGEAVKELIDLRESLILTGCQYVVRHDAGRVEKYWFKSLRDKHLNGGNIIISREAFDALGGFDEGLKTGEDYDFCLRAQSQSIKYRVEPAFEAIHLGYPRNIRNFVRREIWHGEGDFRSFKTFINSPVAILSIAYVVAVLVMVGFLLVNMYAVFALFAAVFLVFNLALTRIRFRQVDWGVVLFNSGLNILYFLARAASLLRALKNRRKRY